MPKHEINFDGFIGEGTNTVAGVRAALRAAGRGPIVVNVNSPGGIASEGMAIHNLLKAHPGHVQVAVDYALSAASLIAAAGDTIAVNPGGVVMVHDPAAVTIGPAAAHEQSRNVLEKLAGGYAKAYAAANRLGRAAKKIRKYMIEELWLNGDEAVEFGFADEASSEIGATACAPHFDPKTFTRFTNTPQRLVAMATAKDTTTMPKKFKPAVIQPDDDDDTPPANADREIFNLCAKANLSMVDTDAVMQKANGDIDVARTTVIDMLAAKAGNQQHTPGSSLEAGAGGLGDPNVMRGAMVARLHAAMTGSPVAADSPAASLPDSPYELGTMVLQAAGITPHANKARRIDQMMTMVGGPHSTSDFPALTLESGNRVLLEAYAAASSALKPVARQRSAPDFRAIATLRMGEMPALLEVDEGGEVTYGSRTESKEAFRLRTFARIFALTRQALINDDLNAFGDVIRGWGQAAAAVEANELYALVAGTGPVMAEDGETLWSEAHGNVAVAGGELTIANLDVARTAIRTTKGMDGVTPLALAPKYLVVGPANETRGQVIVNAATSFVATTIEAANPFASRLELLVEPRIEDYAWMLFADPAMAEVISYAYLDGREGPELETRPGWGVLGQEYRAVLDFGAGVTGFRGAFKNLGEEPTA